MPFPLLHRGPLSGLNQKCFHFMFMEAAPQHLSIVVLSILKPPTLSHTRFDPSVSFPRADLKAARCRLESVFLWTGCGLRLKLGFISLFFIQAVLGKKKSTPSSHGPPS